MHIFYTTLISGNQITLTEEESKHALKVLRLTTGDAVQVVDGQGGLYEAVINLPNPKKCELQILNATQQFGLRPYKINIAIAPTKNIDRTEWFIEKATEIGIDSISFLLCERSERKQINLERLEKVVVSAMKQSVKAYKPILQDLVTFKSFLKEQNPKQTYIAHLEEHNRQPLHRVNLATSVCVLIGPEGDFSPTEIQMAYDQGIQAVTLGNSRLRTETAALVACHTLNLLPDLKSA